MEGNLDEIIPFGPTLHPTEAEFRDFKSYVYRVARLPRVASCGCVKIVPPKSFRFKTPKIERLIDSLVIPHPLEQQIQVGRGFYDLKLVQRKALSAADYKRRVDSDAAVIRGKSSQEAERYVSSSVLGAHHRQDAALRRGREGLDHRAGGPVELEPEPAGLGAEVT